MPKLIKELIPNDPLIDMERIYGLPIYVSPDLLKDIESLSSSEDQFDAIAWSIAYCSAMNRKAGTASEAFFDAMVGRRKMQLRAFQRDDYVVITYP